MNGGRKRQRSVLCQPHDDDEADVSSGSTSPEAIFPGCPGGWKLHSVVVSLTTQDLEYRQASSWKASSGFAFSERVPRYPFELVPC